MEWQASRYDISAALGVEAAKGETIPIKKNITNSDGAPARHRRWPKVLIWTFGGLFGAAALALAAGAAYEGIAAAGDASFAPPPQQMFDIGGHRLHLVCEGEGSPTVVLEAGLGGSSLDWILVQSRLATSTRVCAYDRAGMGWSEAGPGPRTPERIAEELHTLLSIAGISPPYLMVAHSLGAKNIRMFDLQHPDEVVGMVLVDGRSEFMDEIASQSDADSFTAALADQARLFTFARQIGIARLFGAELLVGEPGLPRDVATRMALLQTSALAIETATLEGTARSASDETLQGSTLGSLPLVILAAGDNMKNLPNWPEAQNSLAALSTAGRLVVAEDSGHYIQLEDPDLVLTTVAEMLAEIRQAP